MKHFSFFITILCLFLISACGPIQIQENRNTSPLSANTNGLMTGGDRDEHGCIGSAGYSWCAYKEQCMRLWEESCFDSDEQEIAYLLSKKYNKTLSEVSVTISDNTEDHLRGSVLFASNGAPGEGEGGLVLAVKEGFFWKLVFDGNGSVNCDTIKNTYAFPASMLTGICD